MKVLATFFSMVSDRVIKLEELGLIAVLFGVAVTGAALRRRTWQPKRADEGIGSL